MKCCSMTAAVVSVLAVCTTLADGAEVQLEGGKAIVTMTLRTDSTYDVIIQLERSSNNSGDLLIAPLLTADMRIVEQQRLSLSRFGEGKTTKAAFTIDTSKGSKCNVVVAWQRPNGDVVREAIVASSNGKDTTASRMPWPTAAQTRANIQYSVVVRPEIDRWLGQGPCVVTWGKEDIVIPAPSWAHSDKRMPLGVMASVKDTLPIQCLPLALNNEAVIAAEGGKIKGAIETLEQADRLATLLNIRSDLVGVLWLNQGLFAYINGDKLNANRYWRRVERAPKEHSGVSGVLCLMARRRMETLVTEVVPGIGLARYASSPEISLGTLVNDALSEGEYGTALLGQAKALDLVEGVFSAIGSDEIVGISALDKTLFLLLKNIDTGRLRLFEIELDSGKLVHQQVVSAEGSVLLIQAVAQGCWVVSQNEAKVSLYGHDGILTSANVSTAKRGKSQCVGTFFDGSQWWLLTTAHNDTFTAKPEAELYRLEKSEFVLDARVRVPMDSARIVGLAFAAPGTIDLIAQGRRGLKNAQTAVKRLIEENGDVIVLNAGGAAKVAMQQLAEATSVSEVQWLAVCRFSGQDKTATVTVLRDFSGKALGTVGASSQVVAAQGSRHANALITCEQRFGNRRFYSLIVLDRLHTLRAVLPMMSSPSVRSNAKGPVVAFVNDAIIWFDMDAGTLLQLDYTGDTSWTSATAAPYVPTAKKPIIIREGEMVFLQGKDREGRISWPGKPEAMAISPNGQLGAALLPSSSSERLLRVVNAKQETVKEVAIPNADHIAKLSLANDGTAVVYLVMHKEDDLRLMLNPSRPAAKPLPLPERPVFLLSSDDKVQPISIAGKPVTAFALPDGLSIVHYMTDEDVHTLCGLEKGTVKWSVKLQTGTEREMVVTWINYGDKPTIGVQGARWFREYDLSGKIIREKQIGLPIETQPATNTTQRNDGQGN